MNHFLILLQPGTNFVGIIAMSHSYSGAATRACGFVSVEPTKVKKKISLICTYSHYFIISKI